MLNSFYDPNTGDEVFPRTQKAKGVFALQKFYYNVPPFMLVQDITTMTTMWRRAVRMTGTNLFARPCPVRPRHGFVDSRIVNTASEAKQLFAEAIAADPEAELILMRPINADWSAIWVPGQIVIGPGTDGATSGHDSFSVSLVNNPIGMPSGLAKLADITSPDVPYVEIVVSQTTFDPYYVQVRGGPAIVGNGTDYIPETMKVEHVVRAQGDLLAWENKTKRFKPGTVVYHRGGSLASHYAVHCVLNNIPVIISHRPRIGEVLQKPTIQKAPVTMQSVLNGIGAGTAFNLTRNRTDAVAALLTGLHNVAAFGGEDGFWVGAAAAIMQRLGSVALIGELRHAGNPRDMSREGIYDAGLQVPFVARRKLRRALWMFKHYPWKRGFGGSAWYKCGDALRELDESIRNFVKVPEQAEYTKLVGALNQAVNQAHNGGWWLNKFCSEELMNQAAVGNMNAAVKAVSAMGGLRTIPKEHVQQSLMYWTLAGKINEAPPLEFPAMLQQPDDVHMKAIPKLSMTIEWPFAPTPSVQTPTITPTITYTHAYNLTTAELIPIVASTDTSSKDIYAQGKINGNGILHVQYQFGTKTKQPDKPYKTKDIVLNAYHSICLWGDTTNSLAGSSTQYYPLAINSAGDIVLKCGELIKLGSGTLDKTLPKAA